MKDFNKFFEAEVYDISDEVSSRMINQPKIKEDRYFVVHHTGGLGSASQVVQILNKRKRSVQWVVDLDGRIFKTLPTGVMGVHAGRKKYHDKMPGIAGNSKSQGVEVVGKNDPDIKQRMQSDIKQYGYPRQAEAVRQIIKYLGYDKEDIYSHGELSRNKADDEGYTIKQWVLANWDKEVDLSGFSKISSTPPRKSSSSSTPRQETSSKDKGTSSISVSQNYGKGKKFGEAEQRKYETYKFNPKVYWAVYDIDRGGFLARGSNSDQLVYAASVSKAVTGACAVNYNGGTLPTKDDMDKLTRFLVKSNNKVWRAITRLAGGGDNVNKWAQKMGWNMLPGNYCKVRPAKNNSISAAGMCLFWRDVLNNKFTGASIIQKLSGACKTSGTRSKVYTPSDCKIGGKTGLYEQYMHDSAWIIAPNGRRYAIVVLTELASTSIVATMFGGLYREYCVPTLNAKISRIAPKDTTVKQSYIGSSGKLPIVFIGGLDYRAGDYNIKEQAKLLKTSLPAGQKILAFRYVNHENAVEKIQELQGNCYVVVFSKGGDWSDDCASAIKDKTKLYILEPYGAGTTAKNSVQSAVKLGVPPQNVIVGTSAGTGAGIVSGASQTPREEEYKAPNGSSHFGALKWVSKVISKL